MARRVGAHHGQRLRGCGCTFHDVAEPGQEIRTHVGQHFLVIHHEHALPLTAGGRSRLTRGGGGRTDVLGKIEPEGRALAGLAMDRDCAVVAVHDAVDDGQAQARALAGRLGGEKRLENPPQGRLVHAAAGVADGQAGIAAGAQPRFHCRKRRIDRHPFQLHLQPAGMVI